MAPRNDDIANATQIGPIDGTLIGTVNGATMGLNDPANANEFVGMDYFSQFPQTVWYEYVHTKRVVVDLQLANNPVITDIGGNINLTGFQWGVFTLYPGELDAAYIAFSWGGFGNGATETEVGIVYNPGTRIVIAVGGNPGVTGYSEFQLTWKVLEYWDGNLGSTNSVTGSSDLRVTRSSGRSVRTPSPAALTPDATLPSLFPGVNLEKLIGQPPGTAQPCQLFVCGELASENNLYGRDFVMGWSEEVGPFFYSFADSTPNVFPMVNDGSEDYGFNNNLTSFSTVNMIGGSPAGVPVLRSSQFTRHVPMSGSASYYPNPSYDASHTIGTGVDPRGLMLPNPNLYQGDDSSFEGSLGGWTVVQPQSGLNWSIKQTGPGYQSSGALHITHGAGGGYARGPLVPHVFGRLYRAGAWFEAPGGAVAIEVLDARGNVLNNEGVGISVASGWQFLEIAQFDTNFSVDQNLETAVTHVCVTITNGAQGFFGGGDVVVDDVSLTYMDHVGSSAEYHFVDKANHSVVKSGDIPLMSADVPTAMDALILQTQDEQNDPFLLGMAVPSVTAVPSGMTGKPYALAIAYGQNATIKWPPGTNVLRSGQVTASGGDNGAVWGLAELTPGQASYAFTSLGGVINILRPVDSTNFGTVGAFVSGLWGGDISTPVVEAATTASGVNSMRYFATWTGLAPTTYLFLIQEYYESGGAGGTGNQPVAGETFTVSAWMRANEGGSFTVTMSANGFTVFGGSALSGNRLGSQTLFIDNTWRQFNFTATTDGQLHLGLLFAIPMIAGPPGEWFADVSVTDVRVSGGPPLVVDFIRVDDDDPVTLDAWSVGASPSGVTSINVPDVALPTENSYSAIGLWSALINHGGFVSSLGSAIFDTLQYSQPFTGEIYSGMIGAACVDPVVRKLSQISAATDETGTFIAPSVGAVLLFRGKPNQVMPHAAALNEITWSWNPKTSSLFGQPMPISPYTRVVYPQDEDFGFPTNRETPASFGVVEVDQNFNYKATHFILPRNVTTDSGLTLNTAHDLAGNLFYINYEGGKTLNGSGISFGPPTSITLGRYDPVKRVDLGDMFTIGSPFALGDELMAVGQANDGSVLVAEKSSGFFSNHASQLVVRYSSTGNVLFAWDFGALLPNFAALPFADSGTQIGMDYGGNHFWFTCMVYKDSKQEQQILHCYRIHVDDTTLGDPTIVIDYPYNEPGFYSRYIGPRATGPGFYNPGGPYPTFSLATQNAPALGNTDQRTHRS